jgi:hypothetical protein
VRILFTTQSESLRMFDALRGAMAAKTRVTRAGFTVADALFYERWTSENPGFEKQGHALLKEWEVTRKRDAVPDLHLLARYERELGAEAGLFGAIVSDRRLFMGPDCSYSQDYRRRFSDRELLCVLQNALVEIERLFDELKPDALVGFICVSMLEYVAYLFARRRGVRVLNLRPTRIGDRVTLGSILNDPTPEFARAYRGVRERGSTWMDEAHRYVRRVREQHGRYEGVVGPSAKPAAVVNRERQPVWKAPSRVWGNYRRYLAGDARADNHVPDPLRALFFAVAINPIRARLAARLLRGRYVMPNQLRETRYAFYPLHTEPEVSLLVYGRPFVNQIEVIRQLAMSLPADMILVVKEHPWMVGKRTLGAYRKLLNIPRVHFARPDVEARVLVQGASLVAVITGSVALEAAMLGKPVITFGDCPYNLLPPSMVRRCGDVRHLPALVREMLECYENDDEALASYVAATFETSASVNLYSVLLNKKGVHSERTGSYADEIDKLADYALRLMQEPKDATLEPAAAPW